MIRRVRQLAAVVVLFFAPLEANLLHAQGGPVAAEAGFDTDHDGLSDELEQALLMRFAPRFMVDPSDCSRVPAEFRRDVATPTVEAENGSIYGQAFPSKMPGSGMAAAEIHFYHLWRTDCGSHGHPLDAEHVSVLVQAPASGQSAAEWKAVYWFAAAHEDTVCDVSQIARASTLHAEEHGATVWVSPGKHASFFDKRLASRGCGGDLFRETVLLPRGKLIDLGEPVHPMNGSSWVKAPGWALAAKMATSDFPEAPIARLNALPATEIAWFRPGRHPVQGAIAISGTTADAIGGGGKDTADAISLARDSTGNALQRSYRDTVDALAVSANHTRRFLRLTPPK
ncbi:MAG TPA: hypothetical protein VHZ74_17125 [Bryobacteraceae bacterium]|nr:hypothetical protein [Bryobacteraceae bacterium]